VATQIDGLDMHAIRDALEEVLDPDLAARILFEALDEPDAEVTRDLEGVRQFTHGPLERILEGRLGKAGAARVLKLVDDALDPLGGITADDAAWLNDDADVTRAVSGGEGPMNVIVVSRDAKMVERLEVALGPQRIAAATARDPEALAQIGGVLEPDAVIVDGQRGSDIGPPELAGALSSMSKIPLILIWASDQPAGNAVMKALDEWETAYVAIPRSEGVAPLLDYLKARTTGGG
jgi:hypothetical protein